MKKIPVQRISKKDVQSFLPSYPKTANKSDRGHSLIVAGRKGMWGCGLLASRAAYMMGSGYVTWASQTYPYEQSIEIPEALLGLLKDKDLFENKTALGVGPGLGFSKDVKTFIKSLKNLKLPILLDADALTLISKEKDFQLNKNFLITPHAGEMSRLIGVSSQQIEKNRLEYVVKTAKKYNCFVLLKGHESLLSNGKKSYLFETGNEALSKAGTGDVLTGMITGLMAQGLSVFKACSLSVILHGEVAVRWVEKGKDVNSFLASHILEDLPFVMSEF